MEQPCKKLLQIYLCNNYNNYTSAENVRVNEWVRWHLKQQGLKTGLESFFKKYANGEDREFQAFETWHNCLYV